jgi:hypothetical protein
MGIQCYIVTHHVLDFIDFDIDQLLPIPQTEILDTGIHGFCFTYFRDQNQDFGCTKNRL